MAYRTDCQLFCRIIDSVGSKSGFVQKVARGGLWHEKVGWCWWAGLRHSSRSGSADGTVPGLLVVQQLDNWTIKGLLAPNHRIMDGSNYASFQKTI